MIDLKKHGYPRKRDENEPDALVGLPPVDANDLVERLRATALHPIENNIAYIQTAVALMREAAETIIALQGERDEAVGKAERQWAGWVKEDCARRAAEAEVARLKAELAAVEAAEEQLGELLAIIHRDGGHYQEAHGTAKAVNDAHLIWADLMSKAEEAEAEIARLKDELAEAHRVIEPFASIARSAALLNDVVAAGEVCRRSVSFLDFERARSFRDGQKTGEEG